LPAPKPTITSVAHYVPERRVTNHDLEELIETTDEWIVERTGIRERRLVESGVATSDLAAGAARKVLEQRGMAADAIDLIIVATVTPDMFFPSTACVLQEKLGASNAWGFDLLGACSGFIYALATGAQFVESGRHDRVLVVGADVMSSIIDFEDRSTCVLFGDGAGAVLLERSSGDTGILDWILRSDGGGGQFLHMPGGGSLHPATAETVSSRRHYVHQYGRNVFKFAVKGMVEVSEAILTRNGMQASDLALYVPHQANLRIINAAAERLGLEASRVAINIDRFANTTAATIPICLSEADAAGTIGAGDMVLLASFGAGFTWGSLLLRWGS
jgi:3-oxoacyl-[acyl-carrier-protein] synthase-3